MVTAQVILQIGHIIGSRSHAAVLCDFDMYLVLRSTPLPVFRGTTKFSNPPKLSLNYLLPAFSLSRPLVTSFNQIVSQPGSMLILRLLCGIALTSLWTG